MDRQIVYPGAIPLETDLLNTNKNAMVGLAKLAAAILGTSTMLNGLACTPDSPASLNVKVAPGEIYSLQNIDGTAYSSLAADTTHSILKQGISLDTLLLSCPAPVTVGQSINYLVQVAYQDTDANAVVLPYYNASNPSQAYSGPNNAGTTNYTTRKGSCVISAKAGVSAATGSQTTPAPDAGYTGAFVVTVAYGQTTITAPNIAAYAGAPFIPSAGLIAGGLQGNACNISAAGGTADAITGAYTPGIAALTNGMTLYVRAGSANATTTPTFTPSSGTIAAKTIVKGNGVALNLGDIAGGGHWVELQYDLTLDKWVLLNPAGGINSRGAQRFTSNGSFTVPAGVSSIYVSGCGGGGGGGGSGGANCTGSWAATGGGGGGGAGQHTVKQAFSVTPGQVLTVTIGGSGSGGSAGAVAGNGGTGTAGGNTTLTGTGVSLTLNGGTGGSGSTGVNGTSVASPGGAGGANGGTSGGYALAVGSYGYDYGGLGGVGGSGPFGTAGPSGGGALGYGCGGGGVQGILTGTTGTGFVGGAGTPGLLIIEW